MGLKETTQTMRKLLDEICTDLDKAEAGNKAAAQRVRTCSIKFAKASKVYRKESIGAEKKSTKAPKKAVKAPAKKKAPTKPAMKKKR
jgi:hypothetical protein